MHRFTMFINAVCLTLLIKLHDADHLPILVQLALHVVTTLVDVAVSVLVWV